MEGAARVLVRVVPVSMAAAKGFTTEGCTMSFVTLRWMTLATMLFVGLTGCSYFSGAATDDESELTELENGEKDDSKDGANNEIAMESLPEEGEFELKLSVGDRFPLLKTVEQRLTQTDKSGASVNTSRTEMMLSLVVDEVLMNGRKKLTVHYHRVQYEHDIRGKRVAYSSERPSETVPTEALLYAGLANNGFSFWLGPENKIVELIGFNDFLKRCLRNVPSQHVASVQQQLESTRSEDGIANFIDESIGLLPYSDDPKHTSVAVKVGASWDLEPRRTESPIPMIATMKCVLKEFSGSSAEIIMTGRISGPPNLITMRGSDGDMKVFVRGGHCTGSCQVDRKTGLPTKSQLQRYLEMVMELPDGQRVQQNKETLSTVTSFLDQSQKPASNSDDQVQQTNFLKSVLGGDHETKRRISRGRKF